MASEISLQITLSASKPSTIKLMNFSPGTLTFDMAGSNKDERIISVATAYAALPISTDIGTEGYGYFRNLDATNYVELGVEVSSAFYPLVKLKAGQLGAFPLAIQAVFVRANTAAVRLMYGILEA